jgi:hypothetical protein
MDTCSFFFLARVRGSVTSLGDHDTLIHLQQSGRLVIFINEVDSYH